MIIGKNILRSRMTKLEEAACKWADARCPEQGPEFIVRPQLRSRGAVPWE